MSIFFTQKQSDHFIDSLQNYSLWTLHIDHRRSGSIRVGHDKVEIRIWPCRLELNQTRGLEAQIWTNVCDKYSSTGRWHAIPARRIEIRKELRGRVHSFSASFLPIRCGSFEFTARVRAPKFESSDWIWATQDAKNELIHVTRIGMNRPELTQGMVRQLAQWFDNLLICWHMHDRGQSRESDESNPSMKYSHHNLTAFVAAFLSVIALSNGTDVSIILFIWNVFSYSWKQVWQWAMFFVKALGLKIVTTPLRYYHGVLEIALSQPRSWKGLKTIFCLLSLPRV